MMSLLSLPGVRVDRAVVYTVASAIALCLAAPAPAQAVDPPATPVAKLKRHELAATALGGIATTENDYYDRVTQPVIAWGLSAEYGYRVAPSVRVGVEGARTAIYNPRVVWGSVWSAMPFVGLHFGNQTVEGGVRAGLGFAYGGRRSAGNVTDRHGPGLAAQVFAELAVLGSNVDLIGRIGIRYTRVAWTDEPAQAYYPTDFPLTLAFVSVGARLKL